MSRLKKKSVVVEKAKKRLAGIESISPDLDLGNGLSVASYLAEIGRTEKKLDKYNTKLSDADKALNVFQDEEKKLNALSERILEAVGSIYGHDSDEYEQAGGTRKSEFKKRARKGTGGTPTA